VATWVIPRVIELTCISWDILPFADDVWGSSDNTLHIALLSRWDENAAATGGGHRGAQRPEWVLTPRPPLPQREGEKEGFPRPPFKWDEERRAHLRAELDGLFAHLYGLHREEFDYILDTFPIVRRKDEARYGEYRTKRLCLEAYDRIATSPEYEELIPEEARRRSQVSVIGEGEVVVSLPPVPAPKPAIGSVEQEKPATAGKVEAAGKADVQMKELEKPAPGAGGAPKGDKIRTKPVPKNQINEFQPPLMDYGLYKCRACGKLVMGFGKEEHNQEVHQGKDPGYEKIGSS
jgi:hypothetical protein